MDTLCFFLLYIGIVSGYFLRDLEDCYGVEELHSLSMECSGIPFLPPPSYGSDDECYEDGISDEEGREEGNATYSENFSIVDMNRRFSRVKYISVGRIK